MIVTFCGHSEFNRTEEYEQILLDILERKIGDSPANFYLGGYGDFDNFAYDCCKKYKATHPCVSLIFITPYMTIEYQNNHLKYQRERYDEIIYPEIEDKPLKFAISYRNKWMVDQSDYIICGICHNWGGAYKTYQYARSKKKSIYNIIDNKS